MYRLECYELGDMKKIFWGRPAYGSASAFGLSTDLIFLSTSKWEETGEWMFYRSSSDLLRLDRKSSYLRKTSTRNKRSQGEGKEASSNSDLIWLDHRSSYLLSGIKWTPSKSQDIHRSL